jgi:hypothetical protein
MTCLNAAASAYSTAWFDCEKDFAGTRINITHILSSALATHTQRASERANKQRWMEQAANGLAVEASRKSHQHKALHYVSLSNVAAIRYCFTINHSLTRAQSTWSLLSISRDSLKKFQSNLLRRRDLLRCFALMCQRREMGKRNFMT